MTRTTRVVVLAGSFLLLVGIANATICTVDEVPSATLLVPHFRVDLEYCTNPAARTTVMTVLNTGPAPALVHVTMWTDTSVPAHAFEVYLTGYDVETIDLGDVFCNAPPDLFATLAARFTGQPDPDDGLCYGFDHGDSFPTARGYVTLDNVITSTTMTPADEAYHTDVLSDVNQLVGSYQLTGAPLHGTFQMGHIEAHETAFFPGAATLYGRYTTAVPDGSGGLLPSAADQREPLPTAWVIRFVQGTSLHLWREATGDASPFPCSQQGPSWYPLPNSRIGGGVPMIVFDDAENAVELEIDAFPLESQQIVVDPNGDLPLPFVKGWLYLSTRYAGVRFPETAGQSLVVAEAATLFHPIPYDNACNINPVVVTPTGPIDDD